MERGDTRIDKQTGRPSRLDGEIVKYTRRRFLSGGGGLVVPQMPPSAGFICQCLRSSERDGQTDTHTQGGTRREREKYMHRQQETGRLERRRQN